MQRRVTVLVLITLISIVGPVPVAAGGASPEARPWLALFEGRTIDLRDGWREAQACASAEHTTVCFRTEAEMDSYLSNTTARASCSTTLRLYDGISYATPVLALSTRSIWLNMSAYGFAARTSSYRVGACSALFADGTNGAGAIYPGSTSAGVQSSTMVSGWSNRIRSVRIS